MAARITKDKAARWQVITPWTRGDVTTEVVAVEITTDSANITIKVIGGRPVTFPLERAKMFLAALTEAVATTEKENVENTGQIVSTNKPT